MQLSDDYKTALVEMVFADPISFQAVMQEEVSTRGIFAPAKVGASRGAASSSAVRRPTPRFSQRFIKKVTDANILDIIDKGSPAGMPGFAESLSAQERASLLAYLKTL